MLFGSETGSKAISFSSKQRSGKRTWLERRHCWTLPTDYPRPLQRDYAGSFAPLALDEKLTAGLKNLSHRHGTTLYMTLMSAWAILLSRLSGQQDVVIGIPTANRGRLEIEGLIGFSLTPLHYARTYRLSYR